MLHSEKGAWRPLRAELAKLQNRQASTAPRVQHLVDLTTRQSGRKDTRRGLGLIRRRFFCSKPRAFGKQTQIAYTNTHRHGKGTGTPRNMREDAKKNKIANTGKVYVITKKKKTPHRMSERSDPDPAPLSRGFHPAKSAASRTGKDEPTCTRPNRVRGNPFKK